MKYGLLAIVVILAFVCCTSMICIPIVLLYFVPSCFPDSRIAKFITDWKSRRKNKVLASDNENEVMTTRSEGKFLAINDHQTQSAL